MTKSTSGSPGFWSTGAQLAKQRTGSSVHPPAVRSAEISLPSDTPADIAELIKILVTFRPSPQLPVPYLTRIIESSDLYAAIGAMCILLDHGQLQSPQWQKAVELSRYEAIRPRAIKFFTDQQQPVFLQKASAQKAESYVADPEKIAQAEHREDWEELIDIKSQLFLSDGQVRHLAEITTHAEYALGWRGGALWTLRLLVLSPLFFASMGQFLAILEAANRIDEIQYVVSFLRQTKLHSEICQVFEAALCLRDKDFRRLAEIAKTIPFGKLPGEVKARLCEIFALANDAKGNYREAYRWFEKLNLFLAKSNAQRFTARLDWLAKLDIAPLDPDERLNHFMMLGFQRSGTTLLENALAAHRQVETFEEIPSIQRMLADIEKLIGSSNDHPAGLKLGYEAARNTYYREVERRIKKDTARVFVDKMPINSVYIETLEKLFPQKKYIFSIRHPYDVVLSCFQQRFRATSLNEHFKRLDTACALYNRVMSNWFGVFPGPTERVLYVRYDDLVLNFEAEMQKVLAFLGVEWDDAVLDFASASEKRKVATPSYVKVRQGLTLGVQTSWKNYRFLFEKPEANPLRHWVERFGYEGLS